jgi:hypothetical protein
MNIQEDYVSFESAKLLKEKGFDWPTEHKLWYVIKEFSTGCHWNSCTHKVGDITREYDEKYCISMPTIQMVMKWLREEKGIAIIPVISSVLDNEKFLWDIKIVVAKTYDTYSQGWVYEKQEAACETAIKYCLENLI